MKHVLIVIAACCLSGIGMSGRGYAQGRVAGAPDRAEGEGPWKQLIIRGVTLINSTLSPPMGPVDIVVEGNRITNVAVVGAPGVPVNEARRPKLVEGGKELDATGMYLLPGFVDTHAHIGGSQAASAEYVFKLWMAHGVTTIADPGCGNGLEWVLDQKKKSAENTITAPRIKAYARFGQGVSGPISTEEQAIAWVRSNKEKGADGIKFFGAEPHIMDAAIKENKRLGLRSKTHHAQVYVGRWNALHSARAGLTALEHWYGLPEAMFTDRTVQDYSLSYNYQDEQDRFGEAGQLWEQAAEPYSERWNKVMDELIALDFTLSPTLVIYEASRDLMRARRSEWHEEYTLPSLWEFYKPNRVSHGSYWFNWGTEQELQWKRNYQLWMKFINEYKNRGGRVTVGTDAGFIYALYGFAYPREMELLRESGFHPLEVIKAATLNGAESLGMDDEIGSVEVGKLADFVIVDQNPLENLQVLYGTGAIRVTEENEVVRVGGVTYTVKDGIVYDAKKLLDDVKEMVRQEKAKEKYEILQPGIYHHSMFK
ncbi:amidohydrolase family protein [Parapedobacter sp. ISTM3]|uniref:Amidohydrolase family protein n=1 Tax=Parapedobacter luteus TaxID=623280 RepID=A0A1T5BW00_9SPHI|nr:MULTISPECIES: amidohydrolase family protein [Parapedobacter]MBK1442329.1 amidohydrolase family protein [Parapedobacter sp. ISTM3]SKB51376.1 Amidohydrolase family protein [Parapedobacter luteus]